MTRKPKATLTKGKPKVWHEFSCVFMDGDSKFCFTVWARDFADAERRLGIIRQTATLSGQVYKRSS